MILPGFIDAHAHVSAAVSLLYEAQLFGEPREAYPGIVREFAAAHPQAAAVRGAGWNAVSNAARAMFMEAETGSIEPGKSADVVVVDRDLLTVPPDEIGAASVLLTLFQGREVFRDPSL